VNTDFDPPLLIRAERRREWRRSTQECARKSGKERKTSDFEPFTLVTMDISGAPHDPQGTDWQTERDHQVEEIPEPETHVRSAEVDQASS
jgi:hypothetical protein